MRVGPCFSWSRKRGGSTAKGAGGYDGGRGVERRLLDRRRLVFDELSSDTNKFSGGISILDVLL